MSGNERSGLPDALRRCALEPVRCALVAGDERCMARCGTSVADIGDALGVAAVPFDCTGWDGLPSEPAGSAGEPAFALAIGLALRGVWE
ncbi:hypothetical protein SAMN02787148_117133 [Burkholderia vietnamiensis]|nr:hypothetical protein EC918_11045 [Burkholderia vietnamiensis]SCZ40338.1 hypothetical protein SAMN02787148_117133 [Burkholderia vietnamiensis]SFY22845.1 hypothetical protein SAMN02787160_11744 [Burkholderia vietnamiensis]